MSSSLKFFRQPSLGKLSASKSRAINKKVDNSARNTQQNTLDSEEGEADEKCPDDEDESHDDCSLANFQPAKSAERSSKSDVPSKNKHKFTCKGDGACYWVGEHGDHQSPTFVIRLTGHKRHLASLMTAFSAVKKSSYSPHVFCDAVPKPIQQKFSDSPPVSDPNETKIGADSETGKSSIRAQDVLQHINGHLLFVHDGKGAHQPVYMYFSQIAREWYVSCCDNKQMAGDEGVI